MAPSAAWLAGAGSQRFASLLILRLVQRGRGPEVQVICFDPSIRSEVIRKQTLPHAVKVFQNREKMADMVEAWAAREQIGIHSRYWGGHVPMQPDIQEDSVKLCMVFLERLTRRDTMASIFPEADDEDGFQQLRFAKAD